MKYLLSVLIFLIVGIISHAQPLPKIGNSAIPAANAVHSFILSNYQGDEPNYSSGNPDYITSTNGGTYILSKIKAYGYQISSANWDTSLVVTYFDSLVINQRGLTEVKFEDSDKKTVYVYDENDRMIQKDIFSVDRSKHEWRHNYYYNASGNLSSAASRCYFYSKYVPSYDSTLYLYNDAGKLSEIRGAISNARRQLYSYNESGDLIEVVNASLIDGKWVKDNDKLHMSYDNSHNILDSVLLWGWDGSTHSEKNGIKYTRDSYGRPLSYVNFQVVDYKYQWKDSSAYTYNNLGQLESKYNSRLAFSGEGEVYLIVTEKYTYNSSGKIETIETKDHDLNFTIKTTISYENDFLKSRLYEFLNDTLVVWEPYQRETYSYTNGGKLLSIITEIFVDSLSTLNPNKKKFEYIYDADGNCTNIDLLFWEDGEWSYFYEVDITIPGTNITVNAHKVELGYTRINPISTNNNFENIPAKFALEQNYPNPFNPETKISFNLPASGKANLKVYDMLGREVAELVNGEMEKGLHSVNFNGRNLSSGIYIYRLQAGSFTESKKMILMK